MLKAEEKKLGEKLAKSHLILTKVIVLGSVVLLFFPLLSYSHLALNYFTFVDIFFFYFMPFLEKKKIYESGKG